MGHGDGFGVLQHPSSGRDRPITLIWIKNVATRPGPARVAGARRDENRLARAVAGWLGGRGRRISPQQFPKRNPTRAMRCSRSVQSVSDCHAVRGIHFFALGSKVFFVAGSQPPRGNHKPVSRRANKARMGVEGPRARGEVVASSPNTRACSVLDPARSGCDGGSTQCYQ